MAGILYLIPTDLAGKPANALLPQATYEVLVTLRHFIVENAKAARAFLKRADYPHPIQELSFSVLDEHTKEVTLPALLEPLVQGHDCGLLSEAGCPAVADPGGALVRYAHARGVKVVPLVGPSAILLALMASGLNGQRFQFHGYLSVDRAKRAAELARLETVSQREDATQIFIETPYRNEAVLDEIFKVCRKETWLCIAVDITMPTESIVTRTIEQWKTHRPSLHRRPAVFLIYRGTK